MCCWWDWPYVWFCTLVFLELYFSKWQDIHFCGSSLFPPKHGTVLGIGSTAVSVTLSKVVGYMCACSVTQSCPTLCDPVECSLLGSSIHGIFQARVLEWVAIFFSRGIFLTQGLNSGFLQSRQILNHLSHQRSLWWALYNPTIYFLYNIIVFATLSVLLPSSLTIW